MDIQQPQTGNGAFEASENGANVDADSSSANPAAAARPSTRENAFPDDQQVLSKNDKVMRAYEASLAAFNAGNWDAAVSLCGKALENIARSELSFTEQSGSLSQLMERLVHQINTDRPFLELSSALKDGGGLAEHFNFERCSNQDIANATLDLIECFVNYIYLFRLRLRQLIDLVRPGSDEVIDMSRGTDLRFSSDPFEHGNGNGNGNGASDWDAHPSGNGNGNGNGHSNGNGDVHSDVNGNGNGNGGFPSDLENDSKDEAPAEEPASKNGQQPALFGRSV